MKYAFINASGEVVQVISGFLTESQLQMFLADYAFLYGATSVISANENTTVWIGGTYTDGVFTEPPQPEPLPEIVEGESEVLPEPEVTEPPDDSIPG
jgi:hypothetical protein